MPAGLRIESDGTIEGTRIYLDDAEVLNVTEVSWHFSPSQGKTSMTMEISNVAINAKGTLEDADALSEAIRRLPPPLTS